MSTKTNRQQVTTGLRASEDQANAELAKVAPVVVAANFSLGVNVVLGLVKQAARILGPDWDAEVVETHHKAKRDAPSGTALAIAGGMLGVLVAWWAVHALVALSGHYLPRAADIRLDMTWPQGVSCRIRLPFRAMEEPDDPPEHVPA